MKRIAVLTSGGDAPGMNAAINAVVNKADDLGIEVFGVSRGYQGLINNEIYPLNTKKVQGICRKGGTVLETARSQEFRTKEGRKKAIQVLKSHKIEGLVVIGGNGSLNGAKVLSKMDSEIKVIGIPASIDNDISGSDFSIGFNTACDVVTKALDNIKDTALSFHTSNEARIFAVETMGRERGWISILAGIAGEADLVIVPEKSSSLTKVVNRIKEIIKEKNDCVILFSEGITNADNFVDQLEAKLGHRVRSTLLGFQQRGGVPTITDRILALRMGVKAVESLKAGESAKMIAIKGDSVKTELLEKNDIGMGSYDYYLDMFKHKVMGL